MIRIRFALILLTAAVLGGCNGSRDNASSNANSNSNANANVAAVFKPLPPLKPTDALNPNFKSCNPYYPLVPGSVAKYVVTYPTGLVADATVVVDSAEENGRKIFVERTQLVDRGGGQEISQSIVRKFVCDGNRILVLSEKTETNVKGEQSSSEFDFRENSVMMADAQSMARKGSTWTHTFGSVTQRPGEAPVKGDAPVSVIFEVLGPDESTTGVGTFKTVKVNRKIGEGFTFDYYAAGIGMVKRQSREGVAWELKEFSGLKAQD